VVSDAIPHDKSCELGTVFLNPVTDRPEKRARCFCCFRREKRSLQLEERDVRFSWLHGPAASRAGPGSSR